MITFTDDSFQKEVLDNPQLTLVDFWAAWCGPCRVIAPIVASLAERYAGRVTIGKLDVDANQTTAGRFGIRSIPTLALFKHGKEVERLVGLRSERDIEAIIEKHLP